jgi:polar amino acid transport system permease protein
VSGADTEELVRRDVANAVASPAYGRWLATAAMLLIAAWFAWIVATNPNFEWPVVAQYFTAAAILRGLGVSLGLTVIAMAIGVALGLLLAVARLSPSRPLYAGAALYIWFFRGTPLLVQLIFWYNLSTLFPTVAIGIPFGPDFAVWNTNDLISPVTAAIAGLGLNEAAYMAEIIRGGLLSVPRGQWETAQAFGMTHSRALRRIILPQAMRAIIPPTGNQLISMIKATSLVSVIAMADLLYSVQAVYNRTFQVIPLLMVAVIWYLLVTSILNVVQGAIERYYARSEQDRAAAPARGVNLALELS